MCIDLAKLCQHYFSEFQSLDPTQPAAVLNLIERLDGFRKSKRWAQWCQACQLCQAVAGGMVTLEDQPAASLHRAFAAASQVNAQDLVAQGLSGLAIKKGLHEKRLQAITQALQD